MCSYVLSIKHIHSSGSFFSLVFSSIPFSPQLHPSVARITSHNVSNPILLPVEIYGFNFFSPTELGTCSFVFLFFLNASNHRFSSFLMDHVLH